MTVPGDKSISHRALMLGGIATGVTRIRGLLTGSDCMATAAALEAMGVEIDRGAGEQWRVQGVGLDGLQPPRAPLDLGNSGTGMRLLAGLLAPQDFESVLVGDDSLMQRPMGRVAEPLKLMGAAIQTSDGRPPVRIAGGSALRGIHYVMPVASAQVKSALLLAGLYAYGETSVEEPAITRDHTERMLRSFGVPVDTTENRITVSPVDRLEAVDLDIPGDFSSAAFFLLAACLAGDPYLVIRNVGMNPTRTGLLDLLLLMGARIDIENPRECGAEPVADLRVWRSDLKGIVVGKESVSLAIDEFPVLCIAAACASGQTEFTGAEELRHKESDRIAVMAEGLRVLGASVRELPDGMIIQGGELNGGDIQSHGDHRIAMAFAMASLRSKQAIHVADTANVATSFPGFVASAGQVGLRISEALP